MYILHRCCVSCLTFCRLPFPEFYRSHCIVYLWAVDIKVLGRKLRNEMKFLKLISRKIVFLNNERNMLKIISYNFKNSKVQKSGDHSIIYSVFFTIWFHLIKLQSAVCTFILEFEHLNCFLLDKYVPSCDSYWWGSNLCNICVWMDGLDHTYRGKINSKQNLFKCRLLNHIFFDFSWIRHTVINYSQNILL